MNPDDPEPCEEDVQYCKASNLFMKVTAWVKDTFWDDALGDVEDYRPLTWEMPALSIVEPWWGDWFQVCTPVTFRATKSAPVAAPLSECQWTGGEDPETGVGETFTTTFLLRLGAQNISVTLDDSGGGGAQSAPEGGGAPETTFPSYPAAPEGAGAQSAPLQAGTVGGTQMANSWGIQKIEWRQTDPGGVLEAIDESDDVRFYPELTVEEATGSGDPHCCELELYVEINRNIKDVKVRFRLFGVDDPSSHDPPIDKNGKDVDGNGYLTNVPLVASG